MVIANEMFYMIFNFFACIEINLSRPTNLHIVSTM
jgi:hypothetical protein